MVNTILGASCRTYCENLNKQVAGTDLEKKSLKDVVVAAWNGGKTLPSFNNAAQASAWTTVVCDALFDVISLALGRSLGWITISCHSSALMG